MNPLLLLGTAPAWLMATSIGRRARHATKPACAALRALDEGGTSLIACADVLSDLAREARAPSDGPHFVVPDGAAASDLRRLHARGWGDLLVQGPQARGVFHVRVRRRLNLAAIPRGNEIASRFLDALMARGPSARVKELEDDCAASERTLRRHVLAGSGRRAGDLVRDLRADLRDHLLIAGARLADIATECGQADASATCASIRQETGMSVRQWRAVLLARSLRGSVDAPRDEAVPSARWGPREMMAEPHHAAHVAGFATSVELRT